MNRGLILALDASPRSHFCIALGHPEGQMRQQAHEVEPGTAGRGHVENLTPRIADLMAAEKTTFADLSGIAVNTGPGSFSGVRAGCATACALAQAARLPVTGIGVMELWAARAMQERAEDTFLVALPAGENLFVQAFRRCSDAPRPLAEATGLAPEAAAAYCRQFAALTLLGGGADGLAAALAAGADAPPWRILRPPEPDAVLLACLAARRPPTAGFPAPVYLRPPDARLPQSARHAKTGKTRKTLL